MTKRIYKRGEAWEYIEDGGSDIIGSSIYELLDAPTHYDYWDDFVDAVYAEVRNAGHTFSKRELGRDLWRTWYDEYQYGHYVGMPKYDRVYETWANGRPLFSLGG